MAITIRGLLDLLAECHGRDALNVLLDKRGLDRGVALDAKKERLARSYRGDMRSFLEDLRLSELRTIAQEEDFELRPGEAYWLPGPTRYSRGDLLDILSRALVDFDIPEEMELVDDDDDHDDLEEEVEDDADEGEGSWPVEDPFPRVGTEWTRPRQLNRVMAALGFDPVQRLRAQRFREIVEAAREAGFEMALTDDGLPLRGDEPSPGIHAKVRLRRILARRDTDRAPPPEIAPTEVVVTARRDHLPLREVPVPASASAYEVALMRLELLTALPSLEREHSALWPRAFVEAAVRGLVLEPHQQTVLGVVAQNFRRGFHDAVPVAARLRPRLDERQWSELLADFARLNGDNPALHVVLEYLGGPSRVPPPSPSAVARISAPPPPARVEPAAPESDARDLGALEDMFD